MRMFNCALLTSRLDVRLIQFTYVHSSIRRCLCAFFNLSSRLTYIVVLSTIVSVCSIFLSRQAFEHSDARRRSKSRTVNLPLTLNQKLKQ